MMGFANKDVPKTLDFCEKFDSPAFAFVCPKREGGAPWLAELKSDVSGFILLKNVEVCGFISFVFFCSWFVLDDI